MGFGLVIAGRGFFAERRSLPAIKLRPILSVLLSLALFALLLPRGRPALATLATMACSTFATADYKWCESLIFAVVITAFAVLLFVYGWAFPSPSGPVGKERLLD
jgi:hypothetical protein